MKNTVFKGCATALITPFTPDGKDVDYLSFEKLVDFQIKNSIDALVVAGTTGESPVLTSEEKINLIKIAKNQADNRIPVIAGTGSNNTEEAVRKSNDAEKEGVNGLLIVTPYYNKCSQDGLIKHYNYIANRVSTPIIVYNVPSRTGVTISPETYKALSEHNNIVAVKEASGDISAFLKSIVLCDDSLDFYSGNDDQTVALMSSGAKGVISVASNIIPSVMHKITELCLTEKCNNASYLLKKHLKLINAMFCDVNPIPVKKACNMLFGFNETARLPLTQLNDDKTYILSKILEDYNLFK